MVTKKREINIFGHMEIAEYICEGVVEPCYKKMTRADINRTGHSSIMRVRSALSKTNPEIGRIGKHKKSHA